MSISDSMIVTASLNLYKHQVSIFQCCPKCYALMLAQASLCFALALLLLYNVSVLTSLPPE